MACTYCYEGRSAIKKKDMDDAVQADVVDFVKKHLENGNIKQFHVSWYGGEPLLNKDAIYNLSSEFKKLCSEKNVGYHASITTNGILLDYETAKRLKDDCAVTAAQVTVDGMPEHHDARRIFLDGKGSFDILVNNIEASREFLQIAVRVNVDKENASSAVELKKYFADKGWKDNPYVYPAPIRDYGNCNYNTSCIFSGNDFARFESKQIEESYALDERNIMRVYPRRMDYFCGAQRLNNFVIDPEGLLYSCWNDVGIVDQSFGDVKNGYDLNENYTKWLLSEPSPKCRECQFLPVCQGGCPHDFFSRGEPTCLSWVHDYKNRLKLAYKDHISKKNSESSEVAAQCQCGA